MEQPKRVKTEQEEALEEVERVVADGVAAENARLVAGGAGVGDRPEEGRPLSPEFIMSLDGAFGHGFIYYGPGGEYREWPVANVIVSYDEEKNCVVFSDGAGPLPRVQMSGARPNAYAEVPKGTPFALEKPLPPRTVIGDCYGWRSPDVRQHARAFGDGNGVENLSEDVRMNGARLPPEAPPRIEEITRRVELMGCEQTRIDVGYLLTLIRALTGGGA